MVTLPKIKIGRHSKRAFFDMSHDVNTTCDFGFCQPTLMQDLIPNTRFDLSTRGFVRLSPMPVPTFGRMKVKQITRCIDLKDVFTDFKHFIAKRKIFNNNMSMPNQLTQCDYLYLSEIFATLQCIQREYIFKGGTSYADYENVDANDVLFRLSLHTNGPMKEGQETTPVGNLGGYFYNVFDSFDGTPGMGNTAYNQLAALIDGNVINTFNLFGVWRSNPNSLRSSFDDYSDFDNTRAGTLRTSLLQWLTNNQNVHSFVDRQVVSANLGSYDQYYLTSGGINLPGNLKHLFDAPMTLDNADFIMDFPGLNVNYNLITANGEVQQKTITAAKVGIHLTPAGRRIFKILYAIGIDTSTKDFKIPLYKLFAYYKAWFDTFNVGRVRNWEMTYCHSLIDRFHENPGFPFKSIFDFWQSDSPDLCLFPFKNFAEFLRELPRCCYVLDADPYTCCTQDPLLDTATQDLQYSVNLLPQKVNNSTLGFSYDTVQPTGATVYGNISGNTPFMNALTIKALQMTLPFLNKGSQLSNKVHEILSVKYGVKLPPTDFVGEQEFSISVDDVFSTAETAEGTLGEYAGKAVGGIGSKDNPAKKFTYETGEDCFSFLVQFTCVVPYGGYSQSVPHHSIDVNEWFMSEYDSLGMEPVSYSQLMGRIYNAKYIQDNQKLFGFRPRYMCYKYHDNLANGGFAFRSQLGYFMPYMLDRYFTPADVEVYKDASSHYPGTSYVRDNQSVKLTPSEELRYIGLTESYGNYDRIFIDNTGQSDNFILTLYQDFKIYSPMKPISESYDAYDPERDDDTVKTKIA